MDNIIKQVRNLGEGATDHLRLKLMTTLRDLSISLEKPNDTLERIVNTPLELAEARIGSDLGIFKYLSSRDAPVPLTTLAEATGADPVLLGRLLRYLSSMKQIEEPDLEVFAANNVTHALASPRGKNQVDLYFEVVYPSFMELPRFLARVGYNNPTDVSKAALQDALNWKGTMFTYYAAHPEQGEKFNKHMMFRREDERGWMDSKVFRIDKEAEGWPADKPIFVDVGGGLGHQPALLKASYPDLPGQVIVQDLPEVIQDALSTPGVQNMAYNIFDPQPIQGAKFYYMRGVCHDFPDDKVNEILGNIATAMGPNSLLLLDEMVLPDKNVSWQATAMDQLMMSTLGAQERTYSHWARLLRTVGLKIRYNISYGRNEYESLIVAVKLKIA